MGSARYVELTNINEAGPMVWALVTPILDCLSMLSMVDCLERGKKPTDITIKSIFDIGALGL